MSKTEVKQFHQTLAERFPRAFPLEQESIKPLKIGIDKDLIERLGDEANPNLIRRVLANQTERACYYLAVLYGRGVRVDLDGNPAGVVDEKAKAIAAQKITDIQKRQKAQSERYQAHVKAEKIAQQEKAKRKAELERRRREKEERRRIHAERVQKAKEHKEREAQAAAQQQPAEKPKKEITYSLTEKKKPEIKVKKRRKLTIVKPKNPKQ
jgi:ProP effector